MVSYNDDVLPRLMNWACGARALAPWRQKVCEGLSGAVVEIGFGSGHNVPYYPSEIDVVYALEPDAIALKLAKKRIASAFVSIKPVGLDGQSIPLDDASCDMALTTFTLCTVPDPALALRELWRVLKPGGQLHFLEHGLGPGRALAFSQRLLDPLERRIAGGCHLTRQPLTLVRGADFEMVWSQVGPAKGPKPWSYFSLGVAAKA
ncbi:MAG TPA: class I SAM-dependent methyltransferase [Acidimicrobiales bacterium]|nr:class I SAM-dependent methyltransferase [Acidimicrobiales bacterium]